MGLTNYTKAIPPRCKSCRHIEDDDPKRILTRSIDEFDQDVVAVTCPTLRCGIGWLSGYAYKHIVIEDEALISKELLKLLGCEEKDLIKGAPEKDTKPSGLELLAALLGPTYLHRQKMKDMDTYIDISNKKCNKDRVIIGRKLSDLINSKEDLWRKTGELARTIDYCLIEPFNERILAQLEVIEKEIGKSEEIDEVRDLVAALAQKEAMKPNRKVQTFRKLQEIINSKDDLWIEIAKLSRTIEYCEKEFPERMLMEIDLLESILGRTPEIEEVRHLAVSL